MPNYIKLAKVSLLFILISIGNKYSEILNNKKKMKHNSLRGSHFREKDYGSKNNLSKWNCSFTKRDGYLLKNNSSSRFLSKNKSSYVSELTN